MFASTLGLKNVIAADIDPVAVETARKNLEKNRMARSVRLMTGSLSALKRPFDLIVANLSLSVLKDSSRLLARRLTKRGRLVVSGVLGDDVNFLCKIFSTEGLRRKDVSLLNEWASVVYEPTGA
jgi:ribosomal protein L11 methyltransferase